ncbi:MAG: hypothetical protein ACK5NK_03960 [Niabella sp.]
MKTINIIPRFFSFLLLILILNACNKDVEQFADVTPTPNPPPGLATVLAASGYTLYNAIVVKSGLTNVLNDSTRTLTMYVPGNAAVKQAITALSGGAVPAGSPDAVYLGFINSSNFTAATAAGIVQYNTMPQKLDYTSFTHPFPNMQYPSLLNPNPSLSALLRLTTFPSKSNGSFVNNIPIISNNNTAGNGLIYETGALVAPPTRFLWDRINTDADLTYFKAAVERADEGVPAAETLKGYLQNIGANFTVLAPGNTAFQTVLTGLIYQALLAQNVPAGTAMATATALASSPTVFTNPAVTPVLTAQTVRGIVVYHILGSRAFLNNFPTTQTNYPTLLNGAVASHPGVGLKVTMSGVMAVAATAKGAANATAANIAVNPNPDPYGTSDQHYLNGTLHKIDQVLLPQ